MSNKEYNIFFILAITLTSLMFITLIAHVIYLIKHDYVLDSGVVCQSRAHNYGNITLYNCSDSKEYINPPSYKIIKNK